MHVFVISDIHGDAAALEQALTWFDESDASHILCLGDVLNHGPRNDIPEHYQPLKVVELLNQYADRIIAVRGNCDSEVDQALCLFPLLGEYSQLLLGTRRLFACHGHTYSRDRLPPLAQGDIFISGHTHQPLAAQEKGLYVLNPGSVAMPRGAHPASYGLLNSKGFQVRALASQSVLVAINF